MLCVNCKKRQAVVFVSGAIGEQPVEQKGFCMTCARKLGIPQVDELIRQLGMSAEQIEEMENQMAEMSQDGQMPFAMMFGDANAVADGSSDDEYDEDEDEEEEETSSPSDFDLFAQSLGAPAQQEENAEAEEKSEAQPQPKPEDGIMFIPVDSSEEEEEDDDSSDGTPFGRIAKFFGGSFEPGGATFADDSRQSSKKQEKKRERQKKRRKRNFLDTYCTNLTGRAANGELDAVIGRDREIERMVQILSRRTKNNPCLIGEPGVGKTAIVEGLAIRIASGDVPARLAGKEVHMLDLTALVAGTQFRGQFESRIKGLIDEVKAEGNIILFIDEVHNLVGTGDAEGSMNAANILKPALSRGELQVIGATTFTEYRKHIEKDTALERRFQPVTVAEPSLAEAIEVLRGIKGYYETHHRVKVPDAILVRAVHLSERYINDRFLPDKAIDLLDEACACAALRYKILAEYDAVVAQLAQLRAQQDDIQNDTSGQMDYERYANLKTEILKCEQREQELAPEVANCEVLDSDLAHVIELWTGINASRVQESEFAHLASLEDALKAKVKGQDEAISLVASAMRRSRVHISPRRRPASFIFVGPTGVGKTELVKVLAAELFDSPETLIRLDMSEFMEKHSVSKIIGSPPGYIGYDEAGQLTEKVRRKPYAVILFDEIEKAHPDVLNILLQILDEGRITDAQGRNVNFEHTVIIMTSNAGSEKKEGAIGFGKTDAEASREKAMASLGEFLRPEFLARVDEVVVFNPLGEEEFKQIARLMVDEYVAPLAERGVALTVADDAVEYLAKKALGGRSAARDLRSLIRRELEDKLAVMIIERMEKMPRDIVVCVKDDALDFICVE